MKGIIQIVSLSLILIGLNQIISYAGYAQYFGEKFHPILLCFFLQAVGIDFFLKFANSSLDLPPVASAIFPIFIRMFSSMIIAGIFISIGVENMVNFVITFFTVYLFYLIFEIYIVLSNLRSNSNT